MNLEAVAVKRSRTHTRYYAKDGALVPGVTTVLGVLAKPALVPWANKLGLAGVDVKNYVDVLATIGQLGHDMICCHNQQKEFISEEPRDLIDKAENCFLSYLSWEKQHEIVPILCEAPLVSEQYRFGGTVDMFALVDGVPTIVDYKTGKAIYPEHIYQVAAYRQLLTEQGHKVDAVRILQIGRDETEGFSEKVVSDSISSWLIFHHCLEIYRLQKVK
jgi:hypothetical protein